MATILDTKHVTTKKPHDCWGCGGIIPAGRKVEIQSQADEGRVFSVYTCEVCEMFISHPGFDFDDVEGGEDIEIDDEDKPYYGE